MDNHRAALFLYKPHNEASECALERLRSAFNLSRRTGVFLADVSKVRDIHPFYQITTVPALLLFSGGELENVVKGCHESEFLKALLDHEISEAQTSGEQKVAPRVTVYSTPTCSWCTTLKTWLVRNNIRFTDIDVSRDEKAAQELVRRSGQQGVPQTDINGQIIEGFDLNRLKELLGVN